MFENEWILFSIQDKMLQIVIDFLDNPLKLVTVNWISASATLN